MNPQPDTDADDEAPYGYSVEVMDKAREGGAVTMPFGKNSNWGAKKRKRNSRARYPLGNRGYGSRSAPDVQYKLPNS